jgi:hypothetical protein
MFHVTESLIALFLAYCYAATGDLVMGRRAGSAEAWKSILCRGAEPRDRTFIPVFHRPSRPRPPRDGSSADGGG